MTSPRLGCNKYNIDFILSKNIIIRQMEDILYCAPCIIPIDTKKIKKQLYCIYEGCKIYPLYNFTGEKKALYCFQHKINGMNDIINKKCIKEGCIVNPSYNFKGQKKEIILSKT